MNSMMGETVVLLGVSGAGQVQRGLGGRRHFLRVHQVGMSSLSSTAS